MRLLSGQVYKCWNCGKRLNVDDVVGSATVICVDCKRTNRITAKGAQPRRTIDREQY